MTALMDYIRVTTTRLNVEVDSLDSLRYVMVVLKEVRERESSIEMEITPILDMYQMLEHYLPGGLVDKASNSPNPLKSFHAGHDSSGHVMPLR